MGLTISAPLVALVLRGDHQLNAIKAEKLDGVEFGGPFWEHVQQSHAGGFVDAPD